MNESIITMENGTNEALIRKTNSTIKYAEYHTETSHFAVRVVVNAKWGKFLQHY